jgi:large subunit ribosomal protein L13
MEKITDAKIIDAKDMLLGRLASTAAKFALIGNQVVIINCEHAVVSGKRLTVIGNYLHKDSRGTWSHGPFFYTNPSKFVKRTIRGMVPHRQARGDDALKRIMCYNGVPEKFKDKAVPVEGAHISKVRQTKHVKLADLCKSIGGRV